MKLIHSLKCFLLEKKAIRYRALAGGTGLLGVVPLPTSGMARNRALDPQVSQHVQ